MTSESTTVLAAEPGAYAIETSALRRVFGDKVAVAQLELKIRRGTFFGLLGSNGAGKSTTIKMLATLLFWPMLGVLAAIVLGSAVFSTLSLVVACLVKTRERFMGIGQVITMPLFFASNAIYPLEMMPSWLKAVARANPLSYLVDVLRALMIEGGRSTFGLSVDFAMQIAVLVMLVFAAAKLYPTVIR